MDIIFSDMKMALNPDDSHNVSHFYFKVVQSHFYLTWKKNIKLAQIDWLKLNWSQWTVLFDVTKKDDTEILVFPKDS